MEEFSFESHEGLEKFICSMCELGKCYFRWAFLEFFGEAAKHDGGEEEEDAVGEFFDLESLVGEEGFDVTAGVASLVHESDVVGSPEPGKCRDVHDEDSTGFEGAENFGDGGLVIGDVFDCVETDDGVEDVGGEGELFSIGVDEVRESTISRIGERIVA